jgi:ABC-2 type transport system ATP-binding protein
LRRVGAIVEQPSFYPFLSGRENLAGVATFAGLADDAATRARILAVLAQVGLAERANDRYKKYSLGMKQRLGIAAALLTDPELVLLDEPTNGLDPAGMVEVRALISQLARRGTTVFLSSHLLHEVQQVCTRVAVLKEGRLLAQGLVSDLVRTGGGGGMQVAFRAAEEYPRAVEVLREAQNNGADWLHGARYVPPEPGSAPPPGGWYLLVSVALDHAAELNQLLASNDLYAAELRRREDSLEQFFLALTGGQSDGRQMAPAPASVPSVPVQPAAGATMEGAAG